LASFKNQVDMNRDSQVDTFTEANKKSAWVEADSSYFSFDSPLFWGFSRPYRSRTCDTLIKSQGVSTQARKEVKTVFLTP